MENKTVHRHFIRGWNRNAILIVNALRDIVEEHGGVLVQTRKDPFCVDYAVEDTVEHVRFTTGIMHGFAFVMENEKLLFRVELDSNPFFGIIAVCSNVDFVPTAETPSAIVSAQTLFTKDEWLPKTWTEADWNPYEHMTKEQIREKAKLLFDALMTEERKYDEKPRPTWISLVNPGKYTEEV